MYGHKWGSYSISYYISNLIHKWCVQFLQQLWWPSHGGLIYYLSREVLLYNARNENHYI
jgi:hypothetical protein